MFKVEKQPSLTLSSLFGQALLQTSKLIQSIGAQNHDTSEFDRVVTMVESLPLSSDVFALLMARMNNARRYAASSEFGASKYELRLFANSLTKLREQLAA